ncbi:MAG TPA: hypothetical protein VG328_01950 [Stellaceae bacterium]|jgi:hypothetical protein|nr:hypothetical protein [Stellaceae bacterium]
MTANIGAPRVSLRLLLLAGTILSATSASFIAPANAGNPPFVFDPGTLVISSSTYDKTQGAVSHLSVGSKIGTTASAATAVADNNYVNVWKNTSADGNFGVTSAITLTDIDPATGSVLHQGSVPTDQVVTSFPSKSEGGLHITQAWPNAHLVIVGYASPGVGALDVSNSDAVPGQDLSNPVTMAFGSNYAFARTVVSIDSEGNIGYTPTIAYGGDNGRNGLLGSNGLYYMVGNSNAGKAATFGNCPTPPVVSTKTVNCTKPDVTETTGLEVVNPIDAMFLPTTIPANNSAEVDPLLMTIAGDKPGKDNNYRGVTEYGGALYFTKGSGSNGVQSVYTVTSQFPLPTVDQAGAATIGIVPGFPTDVAKTSGGDYTPFAIFFANATTMYVSDEGTGDNTDATTHAGIQKWSLVDGTWYLDYVLSNGLMTTATNLNGPDGQYPDVTTIGLRNMTGVVNGNGNNSTVTLWAATATTNAAVGTSAAGNTGADPNRIVMITDKLSATTMTNQVKNESFVTVAGPTYGTVYRGVAYVESLGQLKN